MCHEDPLIPARPVVSGIPPWADHGDQARQDMDPVLPLSQLWCPCWQSALLALSVPVQRALPDPKPTVPQLNLHMSPGHSQPGWSPTQAEHLGGRKEQALVRVENCCLPGDMPGYQPVPPSMSPANLNLTQSPYLCMWLKSSKLGWIQACHMLPPWPR